MLQEAISIPQEASSKGGLLCKRPSPLQEASSKGGLLVKYYKPCNISRWPAAKTTRRTRRREKASLQSNANKLQWADNELQWVDKTSNRFQKSQLPIKFNASHKAGGNNQLQQRQTTTRKADNNWQRLIRAKCMHMVDDLKVIYSPSPFPLGVPHDKRKAKAKLN